MQLVDLDLQTGSLRHMGFMLGYRDWLAISGRNMLMVAGGDRSAFFGKHLQLCARGRRCRAIPGLPAGHIPLDPTWAPDGRHMAFVLAPAWHTEGFRSRARYRRWLAAHVLWIANADGSGAHPLTPHCRGIQCVRGAIHGPLRGAASPSWTESGLIFERGGGLWYVRRLHSFNAFPIGTITSSLVPSMSKAVYQTWYYAHMNWHDLYAAR